MKTFFTCHLRNTLSALQFVTGKHKYIQNATLALGKMDSSLFLQITFIHSWVEGVALSKNFSNWYHFIRKGYIFHSPCCSKYVLLNTQNLLKIQYLLLSVISKSIIQAHS